MGCICSCYQKNHHRKHKADKSPQIENEIDLYTTNTSMEPFNRLDAILASIPRHRTLNLDRHNIDDTYSHVSTTETISVDGPSFAETISDISFSLNETITDSVPFSVDDMDLLSYVSFDREQGGDKIYMDDENCVICAEYFDDNDHRPVLLPCGHMFCLQCITALAFKRHYRCIECPIDRLTHHITRFRIKEQDNARLTNTTIIENKIEFGLYIGPIDLQDESSTRNIRTNTDISMSMYSFDSEIYFESDSDSDGTTIPVYV